MDEMRELLQVMESIAFELERLRRDTAQAMPLAVSREMQSLLGRANEINGYRSFMQEESIMLQGGDRTRYDFVKAVMFDSIRPAERATYESDFDLFVSRLPYIVCQHLYHWPIQGVSEEVLPDDSLGFYMTKDYYVFQVKAGHNRDSGILRVRLSGVKEDEAGDCNFQLRLQATLEPGQPWYSFYDRKQIGRMCDLDYVLKQIFDLLGQHCQFDLGMYESLTAKGFLAALQDAYVAYGDEPPFPLKSPTKEEISWDAFRYRNGKPRMIAYVLSAAPNEELGTPGFQQPCYAYCTGNRDVFVVRNSPPPLERWRDEVRMIADFLYALRIGPNQEFYQLACGLLSRHATDSPQLPPCSLVQR